MNIIETYQKFIKGETLHTLGTREARSLLDYCRSKLLAAGRTLKAAATGTTSEAKAALLEAHRELQRAGIADGNEAVYNAAAPNEGQLFNGLIAAEAAEQFQELRRLSGRPRSAELDKAVAALSAPATTTAATAPARPTSARAALDRADMLLSKIAALKLPSSTAATRPAPDTRDTYKSATDSTLLGAAAGKAGPDHVKPAERELIARGWQKMMKTGWMKVAD